ncbi:NAD(P)-dependent alcohol dehydrogenase [Maritalea sp.]|uniref:NAD(P)-dependent alcohol dehydrogenase n=1 Tax=Maritalea sp. TaxID=2003361 RepID=UPI003EFA6945
MQAITHHQYGGPQVLQIEDVPKPEPKDDEVLIKVAASTITSAEWRMRTLSMPKGFGLFGRPAFGFFKPRTQILGQELSGTIEAVGAQVNRLKVGDEIFAITNGKFGGHAEYLTLPQDFPIAHKPENLSFDQAAAIPFGGTTALYFLYDKAKIAAGDRVLINGASGAVGSAAVQVAKYFGAQVTAICSAKNHTAIQQLGADFLIDYKSEDFATNGKRYDIIMDCVGNAFYPRVKNSLRPKGRLLSLIPTLSEMLSMLVLKKEDDHQIFTGSAPERAQDLTTLADMAEKGKFTPLIDSTYAFTDFQNAHARVDTGRKTGSVVIQIG